MRFLETAHGKKCFRHTPSTHQPVEAKETHNGLDNISPVTAGCWWSLWLYLAAATDRLLLIFNKCRAAVRARASPRVSQTADRCDGFCAGRLDLGFDGGDPLVFLFFCSYRAGGALGGGPRRLRPGAASRDRSTSLRCPSLHCSAHGATCPPSHAHSHAHAHARTCTHSHTHTHANKCSLV